MLRLGRTPRWHPIPLQSPLATPISVGWGAALTTHSKLVQHLVPRGRRRSWRWTIEYLVWKVAKGKNVAKIMKRIPLFPRSKRQNQRSFRWWQLTEVSPSMKSYKRSCRYSLVYPMIIYPPHLLSTLPRAQAAQQEMTSIMMRRISEVAVWKSPPPPSTEYLLKGFHGVS